MRKLCQKKKTITKKAFCWFLCIVLCGCGSKKGFEENTKKEIILNVVTTYAGSDGNAKKYKEALQSFVNREGITIQDYSCTSNEQFKERMETVFRAGAEPDILFFFTGADSDAFIRQGKVVSIEEIRSQYPEYAKNMDEVYLKASPVDGKSYAVPVNGYWEALYYNSEILKKAGIAIPGKHYTWNTFLEDCEKIKQAGYIPIAASLGEIPHYWWEYCIFNQDQPKEHLQIPKSIHTQAGAAWVNGLKEIRELYERGYFPEKTLSAKEDETFSLFTDGKAAFLLDGSWRIGGIMDACQEASGMLNQDKVNQFGVTYVPAKEKRKTTDMIGGISMGYYISTKAWENKEKREYAVRFVEFMTSEEQVALFSEHSMNALKDVHEKKEIKKNALQQKAIEMLNGATSFTEAVQDQMHGKSRAVMFDEMPQIVTGEMTIEEAVEESIKCIK